MKREFIYKIFSRIPQLETERLILRRMKPSDSEDMYDYARREEVTRYLAWNPHKSRDYTRQYLEYIAGHYAIGDFYDWAIVDKVSGKMIGTCGFTRFDFQSDSGEIGYALNPDFWGREIALEASREVMRFGFERLMLNRIEAKHLAGNDASARVMKKLGMSFEGTHRGAMMIKGGYRDVSVYAILRSEYEKSE